MEATVAVVDRETVGPDTVALTFESPPAFAGEAGQFVKLSATVEGDSYSRFYTLSSPDTDETFELTVEVAEEGGPFSAHLAGLDPGDEIEMAGPFGSDYYEGAPRAVVLAGGPGVGPAVAIAEAALDEGNEAAVVYRHEGEPVHRARLDAIRERGASVVLVESDRDDGAGDGSDGDAAGDDAFAAAVADAVTGGDDEQLFVYGFAEFVDAATAAIEAADADPAAAKVENFG